MAVKQLLRHTYVRLLRDALPDATKMRLRRRWARTARRIGHPISSQFLPRPARVRVRRAMRLTRALVACDLNPLYLDFWPLVSRAWSQVIGVSPTLVLVATSEQVPPALQADPGVHLFTPLEGIHTAFQAQCIRLLFPALLEGEGAVIISDMELMPLSPRYFHGSLARLDASLFVSYRDVLHRRGQVAIAYSAAEPATWREVTGVHREDDVSARLREWAVDLDYDGVRGGAGWYTDQRVLFRLLMGWRGRSERLWMLDDDYTGHRRLERATLEREGRLNAKRRSDIARHRYADFNALVPYDAFGELNNAVVDLAIASTAGRS